MYERWPSIIASWAPGHITTVRCAFYLIAALIPPVLTYLYLRRFRVALWDCLAVVAITSILVVMLAPALRVTYFFPDETSLEEWLFWSFDWPTWLSTFFVSGAGTLSGYLMGRSVWGHITNG